MHFHSKDLGCSGRTQRDSRLGLLVLGQLQYSSHSVWTGRYQICVFREVGDPWLTCTQIDKHRYLGL